MSRRTHLANAQPQPNLGSVTTPKAVTSANDEFFHMYHHAHGEMIPDDDITLPKHITVVLYATEALLYEDAVATLYRFYLKYGLLTPKQIEHIDLNKLFDIRAKNDSDLSPSLSPTVIRPGEKCPNLYINELETKPTRVSGQPLWKGYRRDGLRAAASMKWYFPEGRTSHVLHPHIATLARLLPKLPTTKKYVIHWLACTPYVNRDEKLKVYGRDFTPLAKHKLSFFLLPTGDEKPDKDKNNNSSDIDPKALQFIPPQIRGS